MLLFTKLERNRKTVSSGSKAGKIRVIRVVQRLPLPIIPLCLVSNFLFFLFCLLLDCKVDCCCLPLWGTRVMGRSCSLSSSFLVNFSSSSDSIALSLAKALFSLAISVVCSTPSWNSLEQFDFAILVAFLHFCIAVWPRAVWPGWRAFAPLFLFWLGFCSTRVHPYVTWLF